MTETPTGIVIALIVGGWILASVSVAIAFVWGCRCGEQEAFMKCANAIDFWAFNRNDSLRVLGEMARITGQKNAHQAITNALKRSERKLREQRQQFAEGIKERT